MVNTDRVDAGSSQVVGSSKPCQCSELPVGHSAPFQAVTESALLSCLHMPAGGFGNEKELLNQVTERFQEAGWFPACCCSVARLCAAHTETV